MGFSLLAPLFLAGLAAVAVPVWVHLTARDRREVLRFPSLEFLTRLPYRQVRRQRLRDRFLFALRALALVLLAVAFARPLVGGAALDGGDGGREVVVALDRSYSMAYAGTWERATGAVRDVLDALGPSDRASLLAFAEEAEVIVAPTTDAAARSSALAGVAPGARRTRFAPALRLADQLLLDSPSGDREVVLISDLQAAAWNRSADGQPLSPGVRLTAVDLSAENPANVWIAGVDVRSATGGDGPQTLVLARLVNHGREAVRGLRVELVVDGEVLAGAGVDLPASGSDTVRLGPVAQPPEVARARVRLAGDGPRANRLPADRLAADDDFYLTLAPAEPLAVLLIEAPGARPESTLFLREALAVPSGGATAEDDFVDAPAFAVRSLAVDAVAPADVEAASLVVLHDAPLPGGAAGRALVDHVAGGGGLWVVLGGRSPAAVAVDGGAVEPTGAAALLPGGWRDPVDRLDARGVSLAGIDYDHPALAVFSGPDDGNLAAPRFYRYRPIDVDAGRPGDAGTAVLARYTDGAVALAERRVGDGRVLLWGSPLDNRWSNLPVQPVFLPLVHQLCRYLGGRREAAPWHQVGEVLDLHELLSAEATPPGPEVVTVLVETPSGNRREIALDSDQPLMTLDEAGFYAVRPAGSERAPVPIAVNVDRAESDLTTLDAEAFVAATTAAPDPEAPAPTGTRAETRRQQERRQGAWWYLVLAALALLVTESLWSNRRSQTHPAASTGPATGGE